MHEVALQRSLSEIVAEYDAKKVALPAQLAAFEKAGADLKLACTIEGTYGRQRIEVGHIYMRELEANLLTSAWMHVYSGLNIDQLASPSEKRLFDQSMAAPPEFTMGNLRATFRRYVEDPRGAMLRSLAEVFSELDPFYKSHEKMKIGVAGLPKRVVMSGFGDWSSNGRNKVQVILNALAAFQGRPLVGYDDLRALEKNEDHLKASRGVRLRTFQNGNGHLFFEPDTLRDINMALSEFYGDVLPDTADEKPATPSASTAVSKDLQYYPTPLSVIERVLHSLNGLKGASILEPSCGDGRFMDALRMAGALVYGVEVDPQRADTARAKGHKVLTGNFLTTVPEPKFDHVVMNPPFYGKHYFKHVDHALKFLKPGGTLTAILPITARTDHGLFGPEERWSNRWRDLPVGSFSESGTNINTTVLTLRAPRESIREAA